MANSSKTTASNSSKAKTSSSNKTNASSSSKAKTSSSNKSSTSNSNKTNSSSTNKSNTSSQDAMTKFKMEVANELGVNLKQGYNGNLTSRETGSVGGEMVRQMIKKQEQQMSGK